MKKRTRKMGSVNSPLLCVLMVAGAVAATTGLGTGPGEHSLLLL
ncbi:hypothetical protein E2C01_056329 [Portunus trituberculatus]|uniref:Uncharacterized protein n=1 Tax=Portunus trituberculatus TaxID=210409 RepID=A0A5B7GXD9_PORTR|nr:hypothetical protein [Portunus trituberculatus]